MNQLTAITDADETQYGAAVTCDANGNITQVLETYSTGNPPVINSTLTTDFSYDNLNRLSQHKTTRYVGGGVSKTQYTERNHQYDATGRLAKSDYTQYYQGDTPSISALEHVYAGSRHVQNYDGSSTYGEVWHWAGASNAHGAALKSPNPDTASQKGYNIAAMGGKNTPQRRSWQNPTTEGNQREIFGQGRPMAKSSSGNGANWWLGTKSDPPISGTAVESRFFFEGTVSATDMSRATDVREGGNIGIFGTSLSFAGSFGRVTSEALGRDLNPFGRGDGICPIGGDFYLNGVAPRLPGFPIMVMDGGNSVNGTLGVDLNSRLGIGLFLGESRNGGRAGGGGSCSSCGSRGSSGGGGGDSKSVNTNCPTRFCSVDEGNKWYMNCPPWMDTNRYHGKRVHCCCAPCCTSATNCIPKGAHPFYFCDEYMDPKQIDEFAMLAQGYSVEQVLLAMCKKDTKYECGEKSQRCPVGDEGSGDDGVGENRASCKCDCASVVNDIMSALSTNQSAYNALRDCKSFLGSNSGRPQASTWTCLNRAIQQARQGKLKYYSCYKNHMDNPLCQHCVDNPGWGGASDGDATGPQFIPGPGGFVVCCDNITSGRKDFSWLGSTDCKCNVLSSTLHEMVHMGGCHHTDNAPVNFVDWVGFINCVCANFFAALQPSNPTTGTGIAERR